MKKKNSGKKLNVLLTIKKIGINGEGIGYYKKKITFVKGALPDEVIVCEIMEETPKYIIGKLVKVKEPSPYRVEVKKEYAESGAYGLAHVSYEKQLEYKRNILLDAFDKYYKLPKPDKLVLKTLASPMTEHYRNKNQFPLAVRNGRVIAGLYKEGSNDLVEINEDIALHENGNKITNLAKKCLGKYKVEISVIIFSIMMVLCGCNLLVTDKDKFYMDKNLITTLSDIDIEKSGRDIVIPAKVGDNTVSRIDLAEPYFAWIDSLDVSQVKELESFRLNLFDPKNKSKLKELDFSKNKKLKSILVSVRRTPGERFTK